MKESGKCSCSIEMKDMRNERKESNVVGTKIISILVTLKKKLK